MKQNELDPATAGVKAFYERWHDEVRKADAEMARRAPSWDDLSSEAVTAWMLGYAASIEMAARMAIAIKETIEDMES